MHLRENKNHVTGHVDAVVQAGVRAGGIHVHPAAPGVVPRQLPAAPAQWVDRGMVFEVLSAIASSGGPMVAVVSGISGVGTTALAVWWLYGRRCRDGELYADLSEMDPEDVLGAWLRALGQRTLPDSSAELVLAWRTVAAQRSLAVLIDHAETADQVVPLLPASPHSVVIVTSRDPLPGLVRHGARLIHLGPLTLADTQRLIRVCADQHGIEVDDATVTALAHASGGLPLAAVVAAGRLALPGTVTALPELRDSCSPRREVPEMVYDALPTAAQELYRRFGDHPSRVITTCAAEAMLSPDLRDGAAPALQILEQAKLIHRLPGERYEIPELVQRHARALAEADDQAMRQAARIRAAEVYGEWLVEADWLLNRHRHRYNQRYVELARGTRKARFSGPTEAMTWFRAHKGTLRGLAEQAHVAGEHDVVCRLAEACWGAALKDRCWPFVAAVHAVAVASARAIAHPAASILHTQLSGAHRNLGRLAEAFENAITAQTIAVEAGDEWAESAALSAAGRAHVAEAKALSAAGRETLVAEQLELALARFTESWKISARIDDPRGAALRMRYVAEVLFEAGQPDRAVEHLQDAAERMQDIGDPEGHAGVLHKLVDALIAAGRHTEAHAHAQVAVEIMRNSASAAYIADSLACLGRASEWLGRYDDAREHYTEACDLYVAVADYPSIAGMNAALSELRAATR